MNSARPFYEDGYVRVFHGDARQLPIDDESVHLIITSPPYNCGLKYDGYDDWLPWDEYWYGLIEPSLRECYRVLVCGGRIAVNLANVVRRDVPPGRIAPEYLGRWRRKPAGSGGEAWSLMIAPRLWSLLEDIGFLPREQLTWVKALDPEDIATSTAWGSWAPPAIRSCAPWPSRCSSRARRRTPDLRVGLI